MLAPEWGSLERAIEGEVGLPGSPTYHALRPPFNARFHGVEPKAVVSCAIPQDVTEVIGFVLRHGEDLAVRAGGHSFGGHSSTRGVLVDVTPMRTVTISDDLATVGAGASLGEMYGVLQEQGVTIPGGTCPSVGVSGLTLGGGLGILGRTYGVTSDSLVGAEVVLADGRVVMCDEYHEEDLFWALRGAGCGNFGVVTSLVFRPVPAPEATNLHLSWPFSEAASVIDAWQAWAPNGPDELAASLKVTASDEIERPPSVDVYAAVLGPGTGADGLLGELVSRVGSDPSSSSAERLSFEGTRRFWANLGEADSAPEGAAIPPEPVFMFSKSAFFRRPLPAEAVVTLLDAFARDRADGESRELDFMPWGGAYNRIRPDATAFVHREERFQLKHAVTVQTGASPEEQRAAHTHVARSWGTVHPWGSGRVFQNFADPDLEDWAAAYYGPNLERLMQVKARYDPKNVFRSEQSLGSLP